MANGILTHESLVVAVAVIHVRINSKWILSNSRAIAAMMTSNDR